MSAPTSTILSIPNELLVAIAVAGQEDRVADLNSKTQSATFKSEWTLSHVSQRFRDITVGAPELWTTIETDVSGSEGSVKIRKLYLERSRARQISVALREPREYYILEEGLLDLDERVGDIVSHVNRIRWLRIVLTAVGWEHPKMLAPFRDVAAPCLQHLEIVSTDYDAGTGALFLSGAPKLRSLKIDGITLRLPVPVWTATLTHLDYSASDPDIYNLAAITAQCPFLTHLHLHVAYNANRFHIPTLSFLHISIGDEPADYLSRVVDLFHSPALTELIVHGSHGDQIALLLSLKTLPHSSFPSLTSLTFLTGSCPCEALDGDPPSHSISSPPGVFPALSHLALINQCYTDHLIQDMLGPASQPWPFLKVITLGVKNDSLGSVRDAVEGAVISKRQRGEPLPKIRLLRAPASLEDWTEDSSWDVEMSW
ncbi:hypothetical protein DFH08DRAFT_464462 [Mycena albidolilacea]|uniref:F-box domain-containing protein n=1 Tax=Mycena albidolilacea TaxID=1033008 RepID=A0AAD7AEQ1_9AGAR|nr:hypothetical protein DFH08DRAFT_464462 [Mycena albidolilacea]